MTPLQWKRLLARAAMWIGIIVGSFILIGFASVTWRVYSKERIARQEHLDEVQTLADLSARKTTLEEELKRLDTERGIEEEVRKRYQLTKPGEREIVLVDDKSLNASSTTGEKGGFWATMMSWFPW